MEGFKCFPFMSVRSVCLLRFCTVWVLFDALGGVEGVKALWVAGFCYVCCLIWRWRSLGCVIELAIASSWWLRRCFSRALFVVLRLRNVRTSCLSLVHNVSLRCMLYHALCFSDIFAHTLSR